MLSKEIIETLKEAAQHHVSYRSPIYIVQKNHCKVVKWSTSEIIAKEFIVHQNFSWLVYMTETEEFHTRNEATDFIQNEIESLNKNKEIQNKFIKDNYLSKLNKTESRYIENMMYNMEQDPTSYNAMTLKFKLEGYLDACVHFKKLTKKQAADITNFVL